MKRESMRARRTHYDASSVPTARARVEATGRCRSTPQLMSMPADAASVSFDAAQAVPDRWRQRYRGTRCGSRRSSPRPSMPSIEREREAQAESMASRRRASSRRRHEHDGKTIRWTRRAPARRRFVRCARRRRRSRAVRRQSPTRSELPSRAAERSPVRESQPTRQEYWTDAPARSSSDPRRQKRLHWTSWSPACATTTSLRCLSPASPERSLPRRTTPTHHRHGVDRFFELGAGDSGGLTSLHALRHRRQVYARR